MQPHAATATIPLARHLLRRPPRRLRLRYALQQSRHPQRLQPSKG